MIQSVYGKLGVEEQDDGQVAIKSFVIVMQELLAQDPGRHDMPALPAFLGGELELPIVIMFDGTGHGTNSYNTLAVRNPYMSAAAQALRVFGFGCCTD